MCLQPWLSNIQRACAILSSVAYWAVPYFTALSHKLHDFWKKKMIESKIRVFMTFTTFVWSISHSQKKSARYYHKSTRLHVKYPQFLSGFNRILIFYTDFPEHLKYQISCKSVQLEPSCSMRTDRRTDMATKGVAFSNFVNESKNKSIFNWKGKEVDKLQIYNGNILYSLWGTNWIFYKKVIWFCLQRANYMDRLRQPHLCTTHPLPLHNHPFADTSGRAV